MATDRAGNRATQAIGTVTAFPGNTAPRTPALAASGVNPTTVTLTWDHVHPGCGGQSHHGGHVQGVPQHQPVVHAPDPGADRRGAVRGKFVTAQVTDGGQRGLSIYKVVAVTDQGGTLAVSSASPMAKFRLRSGGGVAVSTIAYC